MEEARVDPVRIIDCAYMCLNPVQSWIIEQTKWNAYGRNVLLERNAYTSGTKLLCINIIEIVFSTVVFGLVNLEK